MRIKIPAIRKKHPGLLIVGLLVFLVGLIVFLYLKTQISKIGQRVSPPMPEIAVAPLVNNPGGPIQKRIGGDNRSYYYELEGSFISKLQAGRAEEISGISGSFVLRGDPLRRKIQVRAGYRGGVIQFGEYEGSFAGNSNWKISDVIKVVDEIKPGELVKLRVVYHLPDISKTAPEYFIETQKILDGLAGEFNSGEYTTSIPENFALFIDGIGVIR